MNNPLYVQETSKERRKRVTEDHIEKQFLWALDELDLKSMHFYDRFGGVPDRYVIGGNWLEFKSLAYVKHVNAFAHFEADQKRKLATFHNAGDRSFGVVLLCNEYENHLLIAPWPSLVNCTKITFAWAKEHLPLIEDKWDVKEAASKWFSKSLQGNSRYDLLPL